MELDVDLDFQRIYAYLDSVKNDIRSLERGNDLGKLRKFSGRVPVPRAIVSMRVADLLANLTKATPRESGKTADMWKVSYSYATQMYTIRNDYPVINFLEFGTPEHIIRAKGPNATAEVRGSFPRTRKAGAKILVFMVGGVKVFAQRVTHPGQRPLKFVTKIVDDFLYSYPFMDGYVSVYIYNQVRML